MAKRQRQILDLGFACCIQLHHTGTANTYSQLLQNRVSDNVGGVKQLLSALPHALVEERHFALDEKAVSNQGSLVIVSGQELGPTHASLRAATAIMRRSTAHHRDF